MKEKLLNKEFNLSEVYNKPELFTELLDAPGYLIYRIRNSVNNKSYIGDTKVSIRFRFLNHPFYSHLKGYLDDNNSHLYNSMKKYGADKFYVSIISFDINSSEEEFIEKYDSFHNGYNLTSHGGGRLETGEVWMKLGDESKRIPSKNYEEYKSKGWSIDSIKYDHWSNLIRMYDPTTGVTVGVSESDLNERLADGWKIGDGYRIGTRKMIKGDKVSYVKLDLIEEYINNGWEFGSNRGSLGYVSVTSPEGSEHHVPRSQAEELISKGWVYGLKSSTRTQSCSLGQVSKFRRIGNQIIDLLNKDNLEINEINFNKYRHKLGLYLPMVPTYKTYITYSRLEDYENHPDKKFREPEVDLIDFTDNAMDLMLFTKYTRLSDENANALKEIISWDEDKRLKEIDYILNTIESSFEFVQFTFSIKGISRNLTHQLVRTRSQTGNQHDVSFQQQSLRTATLQKFNYVTPPSIRNNEEAGEIYSKCMGQLDEIYHKLIDLGIPTQDARGVLPSNVETSIIVKLDLRSLSHMCQERLCLRSQREIRDVVISMVSKVLMIYPWLENLLQPYCGKLGICRFKNFKDCPVKGTIFNPDSGKPWYHDSTHTGKIIDCREDRSRPATKKEIRLQWDEALSSEFEAVPEMQKK